MRSVVVCEAEGCERLAEWAEWYGPERLSRRFLCMVHVSKTLFEVKPIQEVLK